MQEVHAIVLVDATVHDRYVYLDGKFVYYEDDSDRDYCNPNFNAEALAKTLSEAIGVAWERREYPYGPWAFTEEDVAAWVADPDVPPPEGGRRDEHGRCRGRLG